MVYSIHQGHRFFHTAYDRIGIWLSFLLAATCAGCLVAGLLLLLSSGAEGAAEATFGQEGNPKMACPGRWNGLKLAVPGWCNFDPIGTSPMGAVE